MLQYVSNTAAHCGTLQHTTTHCNSIHTHPPPHACTHLSKTPPPPFVSNTLQHTATHRNILQHTAGTFGQQILTLPQALTNTHRKHHHLSVTLPAAFNATPCNTLQHPATPCNTLQHTHTYRKHHHLPVTLSSVFAALPSVCVPPHVGA